MSRHSLPESLELLLDTMCNTFGGVMFIAISMVITLMIFHQQQTPEKQIEAEKKRLEECRKENRTLNERYKREHERLAKFKKLAKPAPGDNTADITAAVADLEQELRDLKRQRDRVNSEIELAEKQIRQLQDNNRRQDEQNSREQEKQKKLLNELEEKNRKLSEELAALRETLKKTPIKQLHFTRNEKTSRGPYMMLIQGNRLYCAGTEPLRSSDFVEVKRDGRIFLLLPRQGTPLAAIDEKNFFAHCPGLLQASHFLYIMVHDDSMAAFVNFRRMARSLGLPIYWAVQNRGILYLTNTSYSAAK